MSDTRRGESKQIADLAVEHGVLGAEAARDALGAFEQRGGGRTFPSFLMHEGLLSIDQLAQVSSGLASPSKADSAVSDPLLGHVFSGCRVEARLGKGGMGTVYAGRRLSDAEPVVLKFLPPNLARDASLRTRFEREGQVLKKLPPHPNVVQFLGVSSGHDQPHIIMELVDGLSLERVLDERWSLPPREAARIVRDVARGLQSVHAHGIVHRDVKPANVVATPTGQVKLLDFGLAKDLDATSVTRPGQKLGTPWYMAPEQWGDHEVDPRSDVFGLGATFYHLVVGEPPFGGKSTLDVARKITLGQYAPPREVVPDLPAVYELVIAQMLMPERAFRYPSMQACVDDLERVLNGEPPHVPCLVRRSEGGRGKALALLPGRRFTLGSDRDCELLIDGEGVRERHALILREATGFLLHDLGTPAGTFLGRMRVQRPTTLRNGDAIRIGAVELEFHDPGRRVGEEAVEAASDLRAHEVPGPLLAGLVAAKDPRAILASILDLKPDAGATARDRQTLARALGEAEAERVLKRAEELAARERRDLPGRLFRLTGTHLGADQDEWLAWWEGGQAAVRPPQALPDRGEGLVRLTVRAGDPSAAGFVVAPGATVSIGRGKRCELRLSHRSVSRLHATCVNLAGRLVLHDMGSRLGTYRGEQRVQRLLLDPGDEVVLGRVKLMVEGYGSEGPARTGLGAYRVSAAAFAALVDLAHPAAATGLVALLREARRTEWLAEPLRQLFAGAETAAAEAAVREVLVQRGEEARKVLSTLLGGDPARYPQTLAERRDGLPAQILPIGWIEATR